MKLRTIALSLYGHPNELSVPFSFETRCLCNFVQRHARVLAIETNGFNQIVIKDDPYANALTTPGLAPEKTLVVPFRLKASRYQNATPEAKQIYFIEILRSGLLQANEFHALPLRALLSKIDEFEATGFRNRWVHQTKRIRGLGVAELQCEMTLNEFRLTLEVRGATGGLVKLDLLSTKPDELCFHYQFKDLTVREDHLVVTDRKSTNGELVRFPLSQFFEREV
jgi:hypothetical protein